MWYTIVVKTDKGQGDHGTDNKVVFDGESCRSDVSSSVYNLRKAGFEVLVFTGKSVGKLIEV